jgi:hypothetical protein
MTRGILLVGQDLYEMAIKSNDQDKAELAESGRQWTSFTQERLSELGRDKKRAYDATLAVAVGDRQAFLSALGQKYGHRALSKFFVTEF